MLSSRIGTRSRARFVCPRRLVLAYRRRGLTHAPLHWTGTCGQPPAPSGPARRRAQTRAFSILWGIVPRAPAIDATAGPARVAGAASARGVARSGRPPASCPVYGVYAHHVDVRNQRDSRQRAGSVEAPPERRARAGATGGRDRLAPANARGLTLRGTAGTVYFNTCGLFGNGGVAERFNAAVLKTAGLPAPGVRIPPPPPPHWTTEYDTRLEGVA